MATVVKFLLASGVKEEWLSFSVDVISSSESDDIVVFAVAISINLVNITLQKIIVLLHT